MDHGPDGGRGRDREIEVVVPDEWVIDAKVVELEEPRPFLEKLSVSGRLSRQANRWLEREAEQRGKLWVVIAAVLGLALALLALL
ncbi:MAG: hypothetical protein ACT4R6_14250 [Gemmatimonadaceae bacterium]